MKRARAQTTERARTHEVGALAGARHALTE